MAARHDAAAASAADWQQVVDEVQALEAIYGDDFRVLECSGVFGEGGSAACASGGEEQLGAAARLAGVEVPSCSPGWTVDCSLLVQVEPPGGSLRLQLCGEEAQPVQPAPELEATADGAVPRNNADGDDPADPERQQQQQQQQQQYSVQYLPPICLHLRLAAGYPSSSPPPGVEISALWLSRPSAQQLQAALLQLWEEQGGAGAPVLYTWADWLQTSALRHLGAEQMLVLVGDGSGGDGRGGGEEAAAAGEVAGISVDRRSEDGIPGCRSAAAVEQDAAAAAEAVLFKLLRYNAVRGHQAFTQGLHTCGVCLEEMRGGAFVRLDCRHAWCQACLSQQAALHVEEGSLERLRCPDPRCGAPLSPAVLQRVLGAEGYERWEALTLQRTLDTMPDAAYCPRCSAFCLEDDDSSSCASCPKCRFVFCSLCLGGWHPGSQCVSSETKLAMLRRKMEGGGRAAVEELRRQELDLLSLAQIEKTAKKCPRCGQATEKAEGCNKITCGGCSTYWCWKCGKEIDGYKHFRSGDCILFDEAEILRWEAQWEEMQAAERIHAAALRNDYVGETAARANRPRGCPCPQCRQLNHRMGNNNHMQCWSCTGHFCYRCRSVLRGKGAGGAHFGPTGCKQHSND